MDPPRNSFGELDTSTAHSLSASNIANDGSSSLKRQTDLISPVAPTTFVEVPPSGSEAELISPLSTDDDYDFSHASTTSPSHHDANAQLTGLPPTPPTLTNSDVAESKPSRPLSPAPLFADRVRNALETQKSRPSTPVMESQSPPTPDPSPPRKHENLLLARPELPHYPSSYADSFKTAEEGRSGTGSSRMQSPFGLGEDSGEENGQYRVRTPLDSILDEQPEEEQNQHTPRQSVQYLVPPVDMERPTSDESDAGEVRAKNYHIESDSDMEPRSAHHLATEQRSTVDDLGPSTAVRKAPKLNTALNHRLWKPFQPGDEIKRPDPSLIYGSSIAWKPKKPMAKDQVPLEREIEPESLETPPVHRPETPQNESPVELQLPEIDAQPEEIRPIRAPEQSPPKLRDFTPTTPPARTPSPPDTRGRESLNENNKIYRFIREENAKRHSAISDGSVQCVVVPAPETKRQLRHTPKRESLRGDIETTSKHSSAESSHKLRHKRAMPSMGSEATPDVTPSRDVVRPAVLESSANHLEGGSILKGHTVSANMTVPIDVRSKDPSSAVKAHRLRRSIRHLDLGHRNLSNPETRPWSGDAATLDAPSPSPHLRRFSHEQRLDKNMHVRRTSLGRSVSPEPEEEPSPRLRRFSNEQRLENNNHIRRTSIGRDSDNYMSLNARLGRAAQELTWHRIEMPDDVSVRHRRVSSDEKTHAASPRRKSFDPRFLHAAATPASQFSGTDAELCEARGVELFPHNNDSLLVVQQAPQQWSNKPHTESTALGGLNAHPVAQPPSFKALVEAPSERDIGRAKHSVESPLTNPRPAPDPPAIQFIPPTPNEELERPLGADGDGKNMQRRPSLAERVRRYSESLIQPLPFGRSGSVRRIQAAKRISSAPEERPIRLSPFWQPRDFWEEYDSSESLDEAEDDDFSPLPAGGDTSNVLNHRRHSSFLPRNMSVRMPGFRGKGGFLLGNSLGLDRHGTNVRRHHVARKTSAEMLKRVAQQHDGGRKRRVFTLPFSSGLQVEYVGLTALGARMRWRRRERAAEKRREILRGSIGARVFHGGDVKTNE